MPRFVAGILAVQPSPPRLVPVSSVIRALLGGFDFLIYAGGGFVIVASSLVAFATLPNLIGLDIALLVFGLLTVALAVLRTWQVSRALRIGDAYVAEVTDASVGVVRWYGSPWGDLARGTAARGSYQLTGSGESGRYYMQQAWALNLQPRARIWVVRVNGHDVLYAPADALAC